MDLGTGDRLAMPSSGTGDGGQARPLPPLAVSGLVVTKAALVRALRVYVPQLVDLEPLEGGRYMLRLAEQE